MNKFLLGFSLISFLTGTILAQSVTSNGNIESKSKTSINKRSSGTAIESGTQISGQLQNAIDVKRAKPGDSVILKTSKDIKQNGQIMVKKGSTIVGKITEVQQRTKGQAMSKLSVAFDSLQNGKMLIPISASIVSLTKSNSQASMNDNSTDVFGSASGTASAGSSGGGGGLLGGVTNTVGNVVNTTTNTVGGVANTIGSASNTLGGTLREIKISQSTDISAQGNSTLSLEGGNLRLEKGTTFNLRLNESSSINNQQ